MTYTGSGLNISNHTLKLSGGGEFDNTNNLTIDNAGSNLTISDNTKVSRVLVSASGTGNGITISYGAAASAGNLVESLHLSSSLSVTSDAAWSLGSITAGSALTFSNDKDLSIGSLSLTGSAEMSLGASDITVSVTNPVSAGNTQIIRNGGGSLNFIGGLTLASGSELIGQGQQISGDIALSGGKLTAEQNTEFTDNISVSADSTIQIDSSRILTYGGQAVDIGASKLKIQGGGSFVNTGTTPIKMNNAGSGLELDNVIVSNVSATAASSQGILETSNDSTVNNLSLDDKLRLSVDSGKTLTVTKPLTVPTQGIALSGAGTLKLSDNLTLNGDATLASGSLTVDAKGLQVNFGGDLNLSGGVVLTDNSTKYHCYPTPR